MLVVGLTGGIGAGKSTLAALLLEKGAHVIDADQLGRDALRPGQPAWHSVVSSFGEEILAAGSMEIDRKRLAGVVFNDPKHLATLNAIVHPRILSAIADDLEGLRGTDAIVILDAALIVEVGLVRSIDVLVAVIADPKIRTERLRRDRNMSRADIEARMKAQADESDVAGKADIVVRNDGDTADLAAEADKVWLKLTELARTKA
ncbi:MAG: dephospho-CoA kinase [Actinomycetota bacterium]|nr:dephospho-CoA kinase [Actinomycetota bacterium]